jgi:hypothetical protein
MEDLRSLYLSSQIRCLLLDPQPLTQEDISARFAEIDEQVAGLTELPPDEALQVIMEKQQESIQRELAWRKTLRERRPKRPWYKRLWAFLGKDL